MKTHVGHPQHRTEATTARPHSGAGAAVAGNPARARRLAVARAVWSGALLTASRTVLPQHRTVLTVLAARHLTQAVLTFRRPEGFAARWAWTADVAHGVSMLGLARLSPAWRPFALSSAASAAVWAYSARKAR